jgi:hypothetical protein
MSKFGLITYIFFIIFLAIISLVVPSGDEPDFEVRVQRMQQIEKSAYSPYGHVQFFDGKPLDYRCIYSSGSQSLMSIISPECIEINIDFLAEKLIHTLTLTAPLFLLSIFRRKFFIFFCNLSRLEFDKRIDATVLAALWPSVIYMLSWTSEEVFTNILLLTFLIISRSKVLVLFLSFWIFKLDHGSFIVLWIFIFFILFFRGMRKFGYKSPLVSLGIVSLLTFFYGGDILKYLVDLDIQSKPAEVYGVIMDKDAYNNYPLLARPLISLISFIFMTASGIKPWILYAYVALFLTSFMFNRVNFAPEQLFELSKNSYANSGIRKKKLILDGSLCDLLAIFATILCIVFVAPTHAFAKYYLFMTPFIFYYFLMWFSKWQVLRFIIIATLALYVNIGIYYLWPM